MNNLTFEFDQWKKLVIDNLPSHTTWEDLYTKTIENITIAPLYNDTESIIELEPTTPTIPVAHYHPNFLQHIEAFYIEKPIKTNEKITNKILFLDIEPQETLLKNNKVYYLYDPFKNIEKEIEDTINLSYIEKITQKKYQKAICIDIAYLQNAGAGIIQQVAYAMAKLVEVISLLGIHTIPHIFIKTAIGSNYFFEIAKIKTLKILWNTIIKEYTNQQTSPFILAETTYRNKSYIEPQNNLIRTTYEIMAAIQANTNAIIANPYTLDTESIQAKELAYKQLLILSHETNLFDIKQPYKQSYYLENITKNIIEQSWQMFLEIENTGGYLTNLKNKIIKKQIKDTAYKEQQAFEKQDVTIISVNKYRDIAQPLESRQPQTSTGIHPKRLAEEQE